MSRMHDTLTIRPARNGYIVEGVAFPDRQAWSGPLYVFEDITTLFAWLKDNYLEGDQPDNNGA